MSLNLQSTNDVLTVLNKIYGVAQKQGNPVTASVLGYGMLGSDYAASPAFQWAKVDSSGFLYVQATSVGNPNVNIAQVGGVATSMGQKLMASSWPVVLASDQSAIPVSQSGTWTVNAVQSGVWSVGRTWTLGSATDSVSAVQSGAWAVAATQSGVWSVGRTWTLGSATDSVAAVQSGTWSVTATGSTTPADAFANPTNALLDFSLLGAFNGTTWDRIKTAEGGRGTSGTGILGVGLMTRDVSSVYRSLDTNSATFADAFTNPPIQSSVLMTQSFPMGFNGTTWDRLRTVGTGILKVGVYDSSSTPISIFSGGFGDSIVNSSYNELIVDSMVTVFNGTSWDRLSSANRSINGQFSAGILGVGVGLIGSTSQVAWSAAGFTGDGNNGLTAGQVGIELYNSSTWDRLRSIQGVSGSPAGIGVTLSNVTGSAVGFLGVVAMGYDNTTNANAYRVLQFEGANPNLRTSIWNDTLEAAVANFAADAVANASMQPSLAVATASMGFNGTTWDRIRTANAINTNYPVGLLGVGLYVRNSSAASATSLFNVAGVADAESTLPLATGGWGFNSTTWDRLRTANGANVTTGTGLLGTATMGFDGTNYQRVGITTANSDAIATSLISLDVLNFNYAFNGTTWDRLQVDASKNLKVLAAQTGTWNIGTVTTVTTLSQFPSAAALSDAFSNPTTTQIGAMLMGWNTSTWDRLQVDSSKRLKIVDPIDVTGVVNNPADVSVSTAAALSMSANLFDSVTLLADDQNGDSILVGNSTRQAYPLRAGASVTLKRVIPNNIYVKAKSGTQTLHVIGGGT